MSNYPVGDEQYEDKVIEKVEQSTSAGGWIVSFVNGWSFFVPPGVEPKAGSSARLYGKGLGYPVRGLFIDGEQSFYLTDEESREKHLNDSYGATPEDWLTRWDKGDSCWSISMGGFGPGYEQALQICMVEYLRYMIDSKQKAEKFDDPEIWDALLKELENYGNHNKLIQKLGPSGAMDNAAKSLAIKMYRYGPKGVMQNDQVKDRHIQISKNFPSVD